MATLCSDISTPAGDKYQNGINAASEQTSSTENIHRRVAVAPVPRCLAQGQSAAGVKAVDLVLPEADHMAKRKTSAGSVKIFSFTRRKNRFRAAPDALSFQALHGADVQDRYVACLRFWRHLMRRPNVNAVLRCIPSRIIPGGYCMLNTPAIRNREISPCSQHEAEVAHHVTTYSIGSPRARAPINICNATVARQQALHSGDTRGLTRDYVNHYILSNRETPFGRAKLNIFLDGGGFQVNTEDSTISDAARR